MRRAWKSHLFLYLVSQNEHEEEEKEDYFRYLYSYVRVILVHTYSFSAPSSWLNWNLRKKIEWRSCDFDFPNCWHCTTVKNSSERRIELRERVHD